MPAYLLLDVTIPKGKNGLPAKESGGKVFVIECRLHELLFVLCAVERVWDTLSAYNRRGQFLKKGSFSFEDDELTLSFVEEWEGDWPSYSQQAYALADLRDDLEGSGTIQIEVKRKTTLLCR